MNETECDHDGGDSETPQDDARTGDADGHAGADNLTQYTTAAQQMQRMEPPVEEALEKPALYTNRELSWLAFNRRVLQEAANPDNPLLERVRFLSITTSNLDEFFMVRYAQVREKTLKGDTREDPSGLAPREQLREIAEAGRAFMEEQIAVLDVSLLPALAREGLRFHALSTLTAGQLHWMEDTFRRELLPTMTPYIHEKKQPVPQVAGRALQIGLLLKAPGGGGQVFATAQLPAGTRRAWRLPGDMGGGFVLVEDMLMLFAAQLVPGYEVEGCWPYRITRDEDFVVSDDAQEHELVAETRKSLKKRKTGAVVRLELDAGASTAFVAQLCEALDVRTEAVYRIAGPLDLRFLNKELYGLGPAEGMDGMDALRYPPFETHMPAPLGTHANVFSALRDGDIFLHHPYDSFDAVLQLVREAASDPRVLAINMTLYRVSGNSPIIRALCDAAEAGKRVTVLLELKARFDEENNIRWAEVLEKSGCDVIYGMPRLKTHSKIVLVVRRESAGLRRYMHLGTGNYNDVTARQYTDMGVMTADAALGEDAQAFFNMITGFSTEPQMQRLIYAPRMLRQSLTALIEAEISHAKAGRPCGITAKMNSLTDPGIIRLLYEASAVGVPIRLIVRGVCCLRAGVARLSETIEVRSIVGRFLEHSRVFRFENGGDVRIYLSSADWMPRNLNRRIELMFPVTDPAVRARVQQVLDIQWRDNVKAWRMLPDGRYERMPREGESLNAQEYLLGVED